MININARNINDAWANAKVLFANKLICKERISRVGGVVECIDPVTTRYDRPDERVLFDINRDANPFFHFMESFWMLAGRNDVAWIKRFNSRIGLYSDDKESFHGAYGYRWRKHFGFDQLTHIISMLKNTPTERRAVLQMWDPRVDGQGSGLDYPCNTVIYFKIRDEYLYMTVSNRSNDVAYGAMGANVVHMSYLQEYMASMIGIGMGPYHQVSDSLHYYVDVWPKVGGDKIVDCGTKIEDPYSTEEVESYRLVDDINSFDKELMSFMSFTEDLSHGLLSFPLAKTKNRIFSDVALPMIKAWNLNTLNKKEALKVCEEIQASDWRKACKEWIQRRIK